MHTPTQKDTPHNPSMIALCCLRFVCLCPVVITLYARRNAQFEGLAPQDDFTIVDTSKKENSGWKGRGGRRYGGRRKNDPQANKGGDMKNISRAAAKTRFNRRKQKIWNSRRFRRQEKKDRGTQEFSVKVSAQAVVASVLASMRVKIKEIHTLSVALVTKHSSNPCEDKHDIVIFNENI